MSDGFFLTVAWVGMAHGLFVLAYWLGTRRARRRVPCPFEIDRITDCIWATTGRAVVVSAETLTAPAHYAIRNPDGTPVEALIIDLGTGVVLFRSAPDPTLWLRTESRPKPRKGA